MPIRITSAIPEQGFEKVRDAIGAILATELANQKILQGFAEEINLYVGRMTPFAQAEVLMINVLIDSANYSNHNERNTNGSTNFFIDIYSTGKESDGEDGGFASSKRRDKFVGMVRYILQDHHYKILDLPVGLIAGTEVSGFENFESKNNQDAANVTMTRLSFAVRIIENQSLWAGTNISAIFTNVKLDLTTKGYKYEQNIN